jgi:hypothetical protein
VQKLMFLMQRPPDPTREQFFDHYLQRHSLLGLALAIQMNGYTVNLTSPADPGPEGPDSITESWTTDVERSWTRQPRFATNMTWRS